MPGVCRARANERRILVGMMGGHVRASFERSYRLAADMKRLLDPTFRYRPSFATDVRKTFAEIRRRNGAAALGNVHGSGEKVTALPLGRARAGKKK